MSPNTIRIVITAVLVLHGIAHGRALLTLLADATGLGSGAWLPVRSWLFPSLGRRTAAIVASVFWLLSTLCFLAAGLLFWGTFASEEYWRQLAIAGSIVSTIGIALFPRTWPGAPNTKLSDLDTVIALVMNLAILVSLLLLNWPPVEMFGK
jgi:hypothetical protein